MDFRRFGSARWDFPSLKVSSFTGLSCHQKGYGLGKVVRVLVVHGHQRLRLKKIGDEPTGLLKSHERRKFVIQGNFA
jgi:hypothetical protein